MITADADEGVVIMESTINQYFADCSREEYLLNSAIKSLVEPKVPLWLEHKKELYKIRDEEEKKKLKTKADKQKEINNLNNKCENALKEWIKTLK